MSTPEPNPYKMLNYPIVNLEQSFTDAEKIQGRANLGIPTSVNQTNKVLTVESATGALGWEEASGGTITDVQVDGVSVVTDGVAEITMPVVPTKTSELQNDSGFITSADLPTVNDGTLTIQKNGATVDTFTANSSSNKTVNITVPTKTSDLTNDSGFVTSGDLPTVNDGTLTIQKNGTTIDTFTANSSTNKTVNIAVPTKTSDLTNDSGFVTSGDLPTVNDGTLTIQKNGTTIDTFTANSSSNKTVNIAVPTKTSDLTNDSGFITSSDIPAAPVSDVQVDGVSVVTSGVANITLPTVNDGTLTIQKNGTTIDTFTANSSSNKTVDISVPTKTSDLTNDSGFITSSDIPAAPVSDVQVDGVSVVTSGVANITLPTVNDGILTIQKNGTTIDTFTANSSANKTVDISVPTKTSDLTNDSGFITSSSLPTVNDGTLTIQKNGTTIDTFTANSSSNKTVDISVPTKTSDLTNDAGFITSAALPTVNDATLTIQKNGSTVDTFTANASSNKTVNITVPTKTSDLTNDSGFITGGDIPAQVQSDWTEPDNNDPAYIQNKPTTVQIVPGANITISDTQNGVVVAADLSSKEDEFDAGDGLEFTTDGQGNRVLQVEAPVDIVAGPGIVIDNPDGNTLRVSQAYPTDETVLYQAATNEGTTLQLDQYVTLSESMTHFERIRIYYAVQKAWAGKGVFESYMVDGDLKVNLHDVWYREQSGFNVWYETFTYNKYTDSDLRFTQAGGVQRAILNTAWNTTSGLTTIVYKIVGVHRLVANN